MDVYCWFINRCNLQRGLRAQWRPPNADEFSLKSRLIISDKGVTHPLRKMICPYSNENRATMTTKGFFFFSSHVWISLLSTFECWYSRSSVLEVTCQEYCAEEHPWSIGGHNYPTLTSSPLIPSLLLSPTLAPAATFRAAVVSSDTRTTIICPKVISSNENRVAASV